MKSLSDIVCGKAVWVGITGGTLLLALGLSACMPPKGRFTREEIEHKIVRLEKKVNALEKVLYKDLDTSEYVDKEAIKGKAYDETGNYRDLKGLRTQGMIEDLARLGVFPDKGVFKPKEPITRAEYVVWLYNANNRLAPPIKRINASQDSAPQFPDVPNTHPAFPYIQGMALGGIPIGLPDGSFQPDRPLTRQEMVALKVGVEKGQELPPDEAGVKTTWNFSDSDKIAPMFTGYVVVDKKLNGPKGTTIDRAFGPDLKKFAPKENVLRHEAAASLWQVGRVTAKQKRDTLNATN